MENDSPMNVLPEDIGLSISSKEIAECIKHGFKEGNGKIMSEVNMLLLTDESGSRLVCVLDGEEKEYHFTYNASTELEAVVSEYLPNLYGKETGAVVVEDPDGNFYKLGAEIDFYNALEKIEFPSSAVLKIYAMVLGVDIFKDTAEFNSIVNENPIAISPEGKPIGFGTVFMTPTGIMPGNEETSFPSMAYVHAVVKKVETKIHSFTKKEFFVLTCKGVIGDFELLCSPEFVNENVKEGSVVAGYVMFRVEILETRKIESDEN